MKHVMSLGLLASLSALSSCAKVPQSTTKFAYRSENALYGTPQARLELIKHGLARNFSAIDICIKTPAKGLNAQEFTLETKLAFAMWLKASGEDTGNDWSYFHFLPQASCDLTASAYSGAVLLASDPSDYRNVIQGPDPFKEASLSCTDQDGGQRCEGASTIVGEGGTGNYRYDYVGTKLDGVMVASPSFSVLSPYVNWESMQTDLGANTKLDAATRSQLVATYRNLLAADNPAFDDLIAFSAMLTHNQIVGGGDQGFQDALHTLLNQGLSDHGPQPYTIKTAAFHVLLHEVGHQFGMSHADHPESGDTTGSAGNAVKNASGAWETSEATMAYGVPYFYLTADDQTGVAAATKSIQTAIAAGDLPSQ